MAKCRCRSDLCGCDIRQGHGINLKGSGTSASPLYIDALPTEVQVKDTPSLDLEVEGTGEQGKPFIISGSATPAFSELRDVNHTGPYPQSKVVGVTGNGDLAFVDPTAVNPGAIHAGAGLSGDGTPGDPLVAEQSGQWGQGSLGDFGSDDTRGAPVYVDSAGQLRSQPFPKTYRQLRALVGQLPS